MDERRPTIMVLLDFSKAFDTVDHDILCGKLEGFFNFSAFSVRLLRSYLKNRLQCVSIGNLMSSPLNVTRGVPQGSILGPLLFSMYINDLHLLLTLTNYHFYADDLQIYHSGELSEMSNCIASVNETLRLIGDWSRRNRLSLNPGKSQAIVFRAPHLNSFNFDDFQCVLDGQVIPYAEKVKNLGLIMDMNLNWSNNVNSIITRVYNVLRRLWPIKCIDSIHIRKRLVTALCMPHFIYADGAQYHRDSLSSRKLQVTFNACTRYVHGLGRFDHISLYENSILGIDFTSFTDLRAMIFIYKLLSHKLPDYLFEKVDFMSSQRTRQLRIRRHRTAQMSNSIFVRGVRLWNSLPIGVRNVGTVKTFRRAFINYISN